MPLDIDPAILTARIDGKTVVAPCLSFTMWIDVTEPAPLLDFYERTMEALGPSFTHYQAESMKSFARVTPRARTMVPTWLLKPAELKYYYAHFRGAEDVHGTSLQVYFQQHTRLTPEQQERYRQNLPRLAPDFHATGLSSSCFRATVALDHPLADPDRFARWALGFETVKTRDFISGGCDLAVNHDIGRGDEVERLVRSLVTRYPGLDWFHFQLNLWLREYDAAAGELVPLVKRAGWITLVNEQGLSRLGGEAELAAALRAKGVSMDKLPHGVALRSGAAPRLGDLSRGDVPYRATAAAIRPVRVRHVGGYRGFGEWAERWLAMLDEPPGAAPGEAR